MTRCSTTFCTCSTILIPIGLFELGKRSNISIQLPVKQLQT